MLLAKGAKGAAAVQLVKQVLEAPGVYVFSELLDSPNIADVCYMLSLYIFSWLIFIYKEFLYFHDLWNNLSDSFKESHSIIYLSDLMINKKKICAKEFGKR